MIFSVAASIHTCLLIVSNEDINKDLVTPSNDQAFQMARPEFGAYIVWSDILGALAELGFLDLVVVVDELGWFRLADVVGVVPSWAELVRVPGKVDVVGGHGYVLGARGHDGEESRVVSEKAGHGCCCRGGCAASRI